MTKLLLILIIGAALLVGGYFVVQKTLVQKQSPQTIEKLTIAWVPNQAPFALMYIAKSKGYFKEEGLDITYNENFTRGIEGLTDALNGNSDIGLSFETPVVRKIYEGEKLRIISTLHTSTKNTAIVGRKDRGILTPADLKGKKIGVTLNSSYEFFLYSYLLSQGIKLSDVIFVDGALNSMASLLKNGKVDAVATGNPFLYDVKKEFSALVTNFGDFRGFLTGRSGENVLVER